MDEGRGASRDRSPVVGPNPELDQFVTKPSPNPEHVYVHGKTPTYQRHGCRCEECKLANRISMRKYREKKTGKPFGTLSVEYEHGTAQRYASARFKCRCDRCVNAYREAKAEYARQWRRGEVGRDAVPSLDEWLFD